MQNAALKFNDSVEGIRVEATPLLATVTIDESKIPGELCEENILHALYNQGIQYGIHPKQVKNIIRQQIFGKPVPVAFHTPAIEGKQGWIEEKIDLSKSNKPKELIDGTIDYKNIDTFITIRKGEVVAKINYPQPGRNGVNIYGKPIFPQNLDEWTPSVGENIELVEDNLLIAEKSGIIYKAKDTIHIDTKLVVKGSVDYSTGHIKFIGDILIHGDVMPGFRVEAQGDIQIKGNVDNATVISTHGNITVEGGAIGKHTSILMANKNINLGYAQGANIDAGQNVTFQNYLINCQTSAKQDIKSIKNNAFISGGCTSAQCNIWVNQLGNKAESNTAIYLHFFDNDKLNKEIDLEKDLLEKLDKSLVDVTQKIKSLKSHLNQNLINKKDLKKLVLDQINLYQSYHKQKGHTEHKIDQLQSKLRIENNKSRSLTILKAIYPKTVINYGTGKKVIRANMPSTHFEIVNGNLKEDAF